MFDAGGVRLHYMEKGKGEPVVLIHGLYSSTKINWQTPDVIGLLSRNYQVVALDLPHCVSWTARSSKPRSEVMT